MTTVVKFLAIAFTAFALIPAGAHLMELPNKIHLPAESYLTVQSIYSGWSLSGVLVVGALLSTLALALTLRGQQGFAGATVAVACIIGTQIIFWSATYPVNAATHNWTLLPESWEHLRARWEYSHAASAVLNVSAFIATVLATLRPN